MEQLNTEGVVQVGEVTTRVLKEARVDVDLAPAIAAAQTRVYEDVAKWCRAHLAAAGPYDDTRTLMELLTWVADRIREVNATIPEAPHG